ncbi:MAG: hypothetical protein K2X90_04400 [Candidatus Babeliaceae bacterium]|nr:hypothetical protein [Candidatus Babeliaceae bacterium]
MKRLLLLSLALFSILPRVHASNQITAFIDNNRYPLAAVATIGVCFGAYRLYAYFTSSRFSVYKTGIKNRYKKQYRNAFVAYIGHTLKRMRIDELKASKTQIVKDALQWLPSRVAQDDIVGNRKRRAEVFNESGSTDAYSEKKEAFEELFDEIVLIFSRLK